MSAATFGWLGIARLGLVQMALGAVVVITTTVLNRIMVVELALPALLPGLLVAWHYVVQFARPRMGHGSDVGGRRTPWIAGGMAVLGAGAVLAALAVAWTGSARSEGLALAVLAFTLIGLGVSAAGTSLLVLLAKQVPPQRRAPAATIVWLMMIAGFAITAGTVGQVLDPYSPARLVTVTAVVAVAAFVVACGALWRLEGRAPAVAALAGGEPVRPDFRAALREVWSEPPARRFTVFVFVSMLAYSAQDLILEPFAGAAFGMTPGQSTALAGLQHGGALFGMVVVALAGQRFAGRALGSMRGWTVGGCLASALALAALAVAGWVGPGWPLQANTFALGAANGAFAIAAIASMMRLAGDGHAAREGVRMGLWGAAQALAFGIGGLGGAAASDLARHIVGAPGPAYGLVFAGEALLFVVSARLARRIGAAPATMSAPPRVVAGALRPSEAL